MCDGFEVVSIALVSPKSHLIESTPVKKLKKFTSKGWQPESSGNIEKSAVTLG